MTDKQAERDDASEKNETADEKPVETVGQMLRRVRLEKQADIRDIAAYLCIRPKFLEDIENDDVSNFPGETYVSGFLRSYAAYLELDPTAIDARFKNERLEKADIARKATEFQADADTMSPDGKIVFLAVVLLAGALFGWKFYADMTDASLKNADVQTAEQTFEPQNPYPVDNVVAVDEEYLPPQETPAVAEKTEETPAEQPAAEEAPQQTEPAAEAVAEPEKVVEPAVAEAAAEPAPVRTPRIYGEKNIDARVVLNATADTWVEVSRVNGEGEKEVFLSRLLHEGDAYRFPNEDGLLLRTGNAGGFDVYVDGKKIKPFGPSGAKRSRILMDADRLLPPSAEEAE